MLVRHWMTLNPYTVTPEENIKSAYSLLKQRGFRQLPVVKEGKLVGIVTHRDLTEALALRKLTVGEIMRYDPRNYFSRYNIGRSSPNGPRSENQFTPCDF